MTKGQELKKNIADNIISLSKEVIDSINVLIEKYEAISDSFDGINFSKQFDSLNQEGNVLLYGGRDAGKTYGCIEKIVFDASEIGLSSVFIRNSGSLIKTRGFDLVKKYCLSNGIDFEYSYNNMYREVRFPNGAKISFKIGEIYHYKESLFECDTIFIDELDEVSEKDLKFIIKNTKFNKIIATVSDLSKPLSQYALDLFPNKYRFTIDDNVSKTEIGINLLDVLKDIDTQKYQAYRYGISEFWK